MGLFGSYVRNEQKQSSDIDLIVEFKPNTPNLYQVKADLRNEIQRQFNLPVDICREKYIKPYFREQILAEAEYV
jgi:predicted nucleotidyltransferase